MKEKEDAHANSLLRRFDIVEKVVVGGEMSCLNPNTYKREDRAEEWVGTERRRENRGGNRRKRTFCSLCVCFPPK